MYLYCYRETYREVLSYLQLREDFRNVQDFQLESKFVLLTYDDAIKVLEEILKNQDLIEDERKRQETENYETSRFWSQIRSPHLLNPLPSDPPLTKEDSGIWRRQLINYLREDGLVYNERNGKLQRIDTNQPIGNLKPGVNKIVVPEPVVPKIEEYYHVRVRIDRGTEKYVDLHRFNLDENTMLDEVVRKYNEEGIEGFYFNGLKVYPSENYTLTIYRTWLDKLNINAHTRFDELWTQVEVKGKDVTTEYSKIPSNPWKDNSQICLGGHLINSSYKIHPEKNKKYCPECGEVTIIECQNCHSPISGDQYKPYSQTIGMHPSSYCESCGTKFPWAKELSLESGESELAGTDNAISWVKWLLSRFHSIVKTLESRDSRGDKKPLRIEDEYDVQYLLTALLRIRFSNVVREGWTPSYAGSSKRMDFIVKDEKIVIETKMTRDNLRDKETGDQLIIDIGHYKQVPVCKNLFCFIYDPKSKLDNPLSLRDLEMDNTDEFAVHVIVNPQIY